MKPNQIIEKLQDLIKTYPEAANEDITIESEVPYQHFVDDITIQPNIYPENPDLNNLKIIVEYKKYAFYN